MGTFQYIEAVNFLLGKLEEPGREAVEKQYFLSDASFDELLLAESELYDAYAAGRLSKTERDLFEARLLITARQQQRAGFAKTLFMYVSFDPAPAKAAVGWTKALKRFLSSQPLLSYSFLTLLVLVLVGSGVWWLTMGRNNGGDIRFASSVTPADPGHDPKSGNFPVHSETPSSQGSRANGEERPNRHNTWEPKRPSVPKAEKRQASPISRSIATLILTPGMARDDSGGRVIDVSSSVAQIELQLQFEPDRHTAYYAVLETPDGQQLWSGRAEHKGDSAIARIPAGRIKTGDYIVTLKGLNAARSYETVAEYSFTVQRR